jgi:hypothetical protein
MCRMHDATGSMQVSGLSTGSMQNGTLALVAVTDGLKQPGRVADPVQGLLRVQGERQRYLVHVEIRSRWKASILWVSWTSVGSCGLPKSPHVTMELSDTRQAFSHR